MKEPRQNKAVKPIRAESVVQMTADDFKRLPVEIGLELARRAASGPTAFTVVSKETGEPIEDRLEDWFVGLMVCVWQDIVADAEGGGS